MRHALAVERERLDHPVAVEPVAVAVAKTFVFGRPVAPEGAGQFGRQAARHRPEGRRDLGGVRIGEGEQPRVTGQALGEFLRGARLQPRGQHQRRARQEPDRVPAGECETVHRADSGQARSRTSRLVPASASRENAASSNDGGPMNPRASLEKP